MLKAYPAPGRRGRSVARLTEGFETLSGTELLAAAHWIAACEQAADAADALAKVYA